MTKKILIVGSDQEESIRIAHVIMAHNGIHVEVCDIEKVIEMGMKKVDFDELPTFPVKLNPIYDKNLISLEYPRIGRGKGDRARNKKDFKSKFKNKFHK